MKQRIDLKKGIKKKKEKHIINKLINITVQVFINNKIPTISS